MEKVKSQQKRWDNRERVTAGLLEWLPFARASFSEFATDQNPQSSAFSSLPTLFADFILPPCIFIPAYFDQCSWRHWMLSVVNITRGEPREVRESQGEDEWTIILHLIMWRYHSGTSDTRKNIFHNIRDSGLLSPDGQTSQNIEWGEVSRLTEPRNITPINVAELVRIQP